MGAHSEQTVSGPTSDSSTVPTALMVEGDIDREKFERVFRALIGRQEGLRTRFTVVGGEAVQEVVQAAKK